MNLKRRIIEIKFCEWLRKIDYRHYICIGITLGFILCQVFVFPYAFERLIESIRDFGISVGYYFAELFGSSRHGINPTVNDLSAMPFELPFHLPATWEEFQSAWKTYWYVWASKENILGYIAWLGDMLYVLCQIILLIVPAVFVVYILLQRYLQKHNNDYDKDSKPLILFKKIIARVYTPVKQWFVEFFAFLHKHKYYGMAWLFWWANCFNLISIVMSFFAYYFYFVVSFDILHLYRQVYKLFIDLAAVINFLPLWAWILLVFIVMDIIRKKIGYATLQHFEMCNRGYINARPIVYMVCGTMGKKKTTTITDMALSQEVMFRDKAFAKIFENDMKFPRFPWCNLENALKRAMENHSVYNLATCRRFVKSKYIKWCKRPLKYRCFGYDYTRYSMTYNDGLKTQSIWEVIEIYAQLYFIYVIQSSLIIANYSVRTDNKLSDFGNFPMWNTDFFKRNSLLADSYSRHSHILDFDSLRLGRKVIEDNKNANNFEFGVVVITEVGKERGNSLELSEKKKKDDTTNQKNDLFNSWLKMVRHSATVDNFPFVRVIVDEQRPESWGADARDLCEIVHICESGDTRLTMPFFNLAELLYGWLFGKFESLYYQYRYVRSDNTLPMYLLKGLTAKISAYYNKIYNTFGYCRLAVQTENGTQDGQIADGKYYLMSKKIYSKRFSTDCFSDFFTEKALRSPVGIDDLDEYASEKATFDELQKQNSYFMYDLLTGFKKDK